MLVLLTDHAAILLQYLPDVPKRIVEVSEIWARPISAASEVSCDDVTRSLVS